MAIGGLSARLLLDEDVHPALAAALRRHGFDAVHASEVGRRALWDGKTLAAYAAGS